jgi:hypothetical protein
MSFVVDSYINRPRLIYTKHTYMCISLFQQSMRWNLILFTGRTNRVRSVSLSHPSSTLYLETQTYVTDTFWIYTGDLLHNRWRWELRAQTTPWRHFSSVDVAPRKRSCTFCYQDLSKRKHMIVYRAVLQIFHYEKPMKYRELCVWCMVVWVLINSTKASG